jgi:hypothetical protein
MNGEKTKAYRLMVGTPEGKKRALGWPRCRWLGNIKMYSYLGVIEWGGVVWIGLARNRTSEELL